MIQIIQKGTNIIRKITICNKCGCIFSYEREDIKDDRDDDFEVPAQFINEWVNCPQCNSGIILKYGR